VSAIRLWSHFRITTMLSPALMPLLPLEVYTTGAALPACIFESDCIYIISSIAARTVVRIYLFAARQRTCAAAWFYPHFTFFRCVFYEARSRGKKGEERDRCTFYYTHTKGNTHFQAYFYRTSPITHQKEPRRGADLFYLYNLLPKVNYKKRSSCESEFRLNWGYGK
jgi:hypothetical protein